MVKLSGPATGVMSVQPAVPRREELAPVAPSADGAAGWPGPAPAQRAFDGAALEVRGVAARDLAALRRLEVVHRLDLPEGYLAPYSAMRAGAGAVARGVLDRTPFFVAGLHSQLLGCAQFRPVLPDRRWLLVALGAAAGVEDPGPLWEALLMHTVRSAGSRGVKRLYARTTHGSAVAAAVQAIGWAPYAEETIFAIQGLAPGLGRSDLRAQEQTDTWAIHQLYNAAVPRQVQYAEAYTSHRWDMRGRRGRGDDGVLAGWLIEEGHHVIGYARTASRGGIHVLELVYHPERTETLDTLIDGALSALPAGRVRRVYCAVRGYQAEAATVLEARGFVPVLEQELHVKYTTASVRVPVGESVTFHVDVREKLPKRVPSFLHGQPRDESAT